MPIFLLHNSRYRKTIKFTVYHSFLSIANAKQLKQLFYRINIAICTISITRPTLHRMNFAINSLLDAVFFGLFVCVNSEVFAKFAAYKYLECSMELYARAPKVPVSEGKKSPYVGVHYFSECIRFREREREVFEERNKIFNYSYTIE